MRPATVKLASTRKAAKGSMSKSHDPVDWGSILAQAPEHVRAVTAAEVILPEQRANALCDDFLREMACHYPL